MYTVGLKHFFGMRQRSVDVYTVDDSGPYRQPNPVSNVKPHNRIDFLTHNDLIKGLSGPGLDPAFKRFAHKLTKNLYALNVCEEWTQMPDLLEFFQDHVSIAMIEAPWLSKSLFLPENLRSRTTLEKSARSKII